LKTLIMVNIENATAVKTARVASLSGLKPLSFPLTARSYDKTALGCGTNKQGAVRYYFGCGDRDDLLGV
jgi:hypothetical protein